MAPIIQNPALVPHVYVYALIIVIAIWPYMSRTVLPWTRRHLYPPIHPLQVLCYCLPYVSCIFFIVHSSLPTPRCPSLVVRPLLSIMPRRLTLVVYFNCRVKFCQKFLSVKHSQKQTSKWTQINGSTHSTPATHVTTTRPHSSAGASRCPILWKALYRRVIHTKRECRYPTTEGSSWDTTPRYSRLYVHLACTRVSLNKPATHRHRNRTGGGGGDPHFH